VLHSLLLAVLGRSPFAYTEYNEPPQPSACTRLQEVEGLKAALQNAEERISGLRTDYEQANSKAQVSLDRAVEQRPAPVRH